MRSRGTIISTTTTLTVQELGMRKKLVTLLYMLIHISTSNLYEVLPATCWDLKLISQLSGYNFDTEVVCLVSVIRLIS